MADTKKASRAMRSEVIVTWIVVILITIGIFAFSIGWGIGYVVIICFITACMRMDTTAEATAMHEPKRIKSTESNDRKYADVDYFIDITQEVDKIFSLQDQLLQDADFLQFAKAHSSITLNGSEPTPKQLIKTLFWADMVRCFVNLGHVPDFGGKEGLGLLCFYARYSGAPNFGYDERKGVLTDTLKREAAMAYIQTAGDLNGFSEVDTVFYISKFLSVYDADLQHQYLVALYRLTSLTAKADGVVTDTEAAWLSQILDLSQGASSQQNSEHQRYTTSAASASAEKPAEKPQPSFAGLKLRMKKLNDLIGLASVKEEVTTLTNFIKIQQQRQSSGLKTSSVSYHCVFTGNPGTGKTTVARIVADIYRNLGILSKGHLVETDRSGLVAEYVGQTAVKTNKIIDSALDGVLFIDEAYSLATAQGANDYGREAIATLLKRMEDNRDRLVVILAGYTSEMQAFIDSNPGLQSRFSRYIEFPDYSADELYQIFQKYIKECDYTLAEDAKASVRAYLEDKVAHKDKNFGNARFVRNLFGRTIERQANRLSKEADLTGAQLSEIRAADISI